eukprot:GDKI01041998.1.p1 GENE.GDKI01041998.1~~GDKI01041998.1.p1  ORF type:complete len:480 (-),score=107.74 GDKI01041998.1:174-1562(-)
MKLSLICSLFVLASCSAAALAQDVQPRAAEVEETTQWSQILNIEMLHDVGGEVKAVSADIPMLGYQDNKSFEVCESMSEDHTHADPHKVSTVHCIGMEGERDGKRQLIRKFLLNTPHDVKERVARGESPPLLFAFHGIGDHCYNFCNIMNRVLDRKRDELQREGIERPVVVCPCGMADSIAYMPFLQIRGWQSGTCCGAGHKTDTTFVDEIIPKVSALLTEHVHGPHRHTPHTPIKFSSFHSWGFSNGGMFSHTLACERAHIFDSVASLGGTNAQKTCPYTHARGEVPYEWRAKADKPAVSVLDIHTLEDTIVAYDKRPAFATLRLTRGAKTSMHQWGERNTCGPTPTELAAKTIPDNCINSLTWSECNTTQKNTQLRAHTHRQLSGSDARTQVELVRCHGNHMDGDLIQSLMYTFRFFHRTKYAIDPASVPQMSRESVACREKHTCRELMANRNLCKDKDE